MGIFDKFKTKKEKELGVKPTAASESPKEKPAKKEVKAVAKKESKKDAVEAKAPAAMKRLEGFASTLIAAPVVTEKTARQVADGKYTFRVIRNATKVSVRNAIEKAYGVHVTGVNVVNVAGKHVRFGRFEGKERNWKKAIVTLKKGERLDVYEGV